MKILGALWPLCGTLLHLIFLKVKNSTCHSETLAETLESGPLCITDLFQNKSAAYF